MASRAPRPIIAALAVVLTTAAVSGCAGARGAAAGPTGVDFSQDQEANYAASQFAQRLFNDLSDLSGYAGGQIVSYGLEVDAVGTPTPEMRAVIDRDAQQYQGNEIPVRFRSVRYSEKELQAVIDQLRVDTDEWKKSGMQLSAYGIDPGTNKVMIDLLHYTDASRDLLLARYGDRVTVDPHDFMVAND